MKETTPTQPGTTPGQSVSTGKAAPSGLPVLAAAWTLVAVPLGWGVIGTLHRAMALFKR